MPGGRRKTDPKHAEYTQDSTAHACVRAKRARVRDRRPSCGRRNAAIKITALEAKQCGKMELEKVRSRLCGQAGGGKQGSEMTVP